jgi:hypothetical protein
MCADLVRADKPTKVPVGIIESGGLPSKGPGIEARGLQAGSSGRAPLATPDGRLHRVLDRASEDDQLKDARRLQGKPDPDRWTSPGQIRGNYDMAI